jgi:hypothetical protein
LAAAIAATISLWTWSSIGVWAASGWSLEMTMLTSSTSRGVNAARCETMIASCLKWTCSLYGCFSNAIYWRTVKMVRLVTEANSHDQNKFPCPGCSDKAIHNCDCYTIYLR